MSIDQNKVFKLGSFHCPANHTNWETTDRYIRHLNAAEVVEAMKGRTWEF